MCEMQGWDRNSSSKMWVLQSGLCALDSGACWASLGCLSLATLCLLQLLSSPAVMAFFFGQFDESLSYQLTGVSVEKMMSASDCLCASL